MNRTFLIILMIATAMMIAVIGRHEPTAQLDTMPWEVDRLENGSLRVFGITLGKTSIQDANQLFANFGKTLFTVTSSANNKTNYQLITQYDELIIGGMIAKIILTYDINQTDLETIYHSLKSENATPKRINHVDFYSVNEKTKMRYLSAAISGVTYIPSIDYDLQSIRQNFGQPAKEKTLNKELQEWSYPEMGLLIHVHSTLPDRFIYKPLK